VHELTLTTERKSQLIDITGEVSAAVAGESGTAALVYVPHTTAGVTINENVDPALVDDFERALEQIVDSQWRWTHDDADGPNAPSHLRASLVGPQVLIPLDNGGLRLGRYQGIFFCEFDGPRSRTVYVSVLG
jgi:secondary thiamine-phosphate synthase enzyme